MQKRASRTSQAEGPSPRPYILVASARANVTIKEESGDQGERKGVCSKEAPKVEHSMTLSPFPEAQCVGAEYETRGPPASRSLVAVALIHIPARQRDRDRCDASSSASAFNGVRQGCPLRSLSTRVKSVECYRLVLFVPHDGSIGHWDWLQNGFAIRSQHGLTVRGTTEKGECATDTERTIRIETSYRKSLAAGI